MPEAVVYLGDRFVEPGAAQVALLDAGYLVGDGVFATLRGYDGRCFRVAAHLAQLARGAELFGLPLGDVWKRLPSLLDEAAERTRARDAYVRVTLTRGAPDAPAPTLSIYARPAVIPSNEDYAKGVATVMVRARRVPPECLDGTIKTTSYAPQLLARREVDARGAVEGIQRAVDGSLACATMANLFLVSGGELRTPPLSTGCRAGVTRSAVLELARSIGLVAREAPLFPDALESAEEIFLTSSRIECLPVASIDGRSIGSTFPVAWKLRNALHELIVAERS